jgi:hypothetical protein
VNPVAAVILEAELNRRGGNLFHRRGNTEAGMFGLPAVSIDD